MQKRCTRELRALVGVEDLRPAKVLYRLFQCLDTEVGIERIGELPGTHGAACPVDDGDEVKRTVRHGNVGYVRGPCLVGTCDGQAFQQVRERRCAALGLLVRFFG